MNIVSVYKTFPTQIACIQYLEEARWRGKPKCPYCSSQRSTTVALENRHHCNGCNRSYSVKIGTIFEDTKLDLQKWFLAIALILNAKKGISSRQLARDMGVNQKTAWYMGMRIRRCMEQDKDLLFGIVEMDETYIGGKPKRHPNTIRGRGTKKIPVIGIVQRGGSVTAKTSKFVSGAALTKMIKEKVDIMNCTLMTDEWKGYAKVKEFMPHKKVNHSSGKYVDGDVHTNTMEGFWGLLKRGITGQYHRLSVEYLDMYINEFCYKYNHRRAISMFDDFLFSSVSV